MLARTALFLGLLLNSSMGWAQLSYTTLGGTYSQVFAGLGTAVNASATGGALGLVNASLDGWFFAETGTNANTVITAGTGSGTAGDTYNFGVAANADRTLGGLQSGSLVPTFGFYLTNNSGSTITNLQISYTGKTWRVGAASRSDRLDFQYSTNATSLTTGTWTDVDALDYANPGQALGSGSVQHSASISSTISSLSIADGATVFIRWNDFNASGSDDGMGVDDFSLIGTGTPATPAITSIMPGFATAGGAGFDLTVNGSDFINGTSTVRWDGTNRTTTFVSATELTAAISASDIATAGSATVTVLNTGNPTPSNGVVFTINPSSAPDCMGVPGGTALPGTPCDDGNTCTINDVYTGTAPDCGCAGTIQDTDGDGTCDADDGCPNDPLKTSPGTCGCDVPEPGATCDDGDPCTINDVLTSCSTCVGTITPDSDGDGVCDGEDGCPNDPSKIFPGLCGCGVLEAGNVCDDGNDCTVNDIYVSCGLCAGTAPSDGWNFGTASGNAAPSTVGLVNATSGPVSSGNSFGATTLLGTTSASTGYTDATGQFNAGVAVALGAQNTATNAYFEFTVTPSAGFAFTLTGFRFGTRSTATGPQAYTLRASTDGYTTDIATGTIANSSTWALKTNTGLSFGDPSGAPITFRLFGHSGSGNPSSGSVNWRIDDLGISVCAAACTDRDGDGICDGVDDCQATASVTGSLLFNAATCGANPGAFLHFTDVSGVQVATDISTCPAGSSCAGGTTPAVACAAGSFSDVTGAVTCTSCAAGSFSSTTGSTSCTSCAAGSFSDTEGSTSCQSCAAGTFSSVSGSIACVACAAGTYNPVTGAVECLTCDGTTNTPIGATECTVTDSDGDGIPDSSDDCQATSAVTGSLLFNAATCGANPGAFLHFTDVSGVQVATDISTCPAGSSCAGGTDPAVACAAGSFSDVTGAVTCTSCAAGSFSSTTGSTSCTSCAAGSFSDTEGSTSCQSCAAGTFSSVSGSIACVACAAGTYNPVTGAVECLTCDGGTDAPIGAAVCLDYPGSPYCPVGTATPSLSGGSGGALYTCSSGACSSLVMDPATGEVDLAASAPGLYVVCSNGACVSLEIRPPVSLDPPSVALNTGSNPSCSGSAVEFHATGTYSDGTSYDGDVSYAWSYGGGTIPSGAFFSVSDPASSSVSVSVSSSRACVSNSDVPSSNSIDLVVTPSVSILPSSLAIEQTAGSNPACSGSSVEFHLTGLYSDGSSATGDLSATWSAGAGSIPSQLFGFTASSSTSSVSVTDVISSRSCVSNSGSVASPPDFALSVTESVSLQPAVVSLTGGSNPACSGSSLEFTATGTYSDGSSYDSDVSYVWAHAGTVITINGSNFYQAQASSSGPVSVSVSSSRACVSNSDVPSSNSIDLVVLENIDYALDGDNDDYYVTGSVVSSCSPPSPLHRPLSLLVDGGDCDDGDADVNPGATEVCDGADNDCDGGVDEGDNVYFRDLDGDGFGDPLVSVSLVCASAPTGFVTNDEDCDDTRLLYADEDGDGVGAGAPVACGVETDTDDCPTVPGQIGSSCDDGNPGTTGDVLNGDCVCVGGTSCVTNPVVLSITTDDNADQITWYLMLTGTNTPVCSGTGLASNSNLTLDCCLPDGCYDLVVTDDFGDGIVGGGFVLRDGTGQRIIDNDGNGGSFTTLSLSPLGFCVPLGTTALQAASCDVEDATLFTVLRAEPDPAVTAQFGLHNTNSGYQFWVTNPNGGFTRRILFTHASPGTAAPGGTPNALKATYFAISTMNNSNPRIPLGILLNVRVRSQVNGVFSAFGPACRLILPTPVCATTQLTTTASPMVSCGATGLTSSSVIWANAVVGATGYQFEFTRPGYTRRILSATRSQALSFVTLPLQNNNCYNVRVRISYDNSATYCPFGPPCTITLGTADCGTIGMAFEQGSGESGIAEDARLSLWPNPNDGSLVNVSLTGFDPSVNVVTMDVADLFGKLVATRTLAVQDGYMNNTINFEQDLAPGLYLVNLQAGDRRYTQRLVIQ